MATLNQATSQETPIFPYMDKLENYEVKEKLGEGTYGVVHKAQNKNTNKIVALKQILINNEDEGFPPSALTEINILQSLIYENIVQLFGTCRSPRNNSSRSNFYLILEYCDHDLLNLIKNTRLIFTVAHIKCIIIQILDGLYFLHNNKIIHRDLKPANILITKDGILKLADFGLSKIMKPREENRENQDTNRYVTLWYRAPELLLGDQNYSMPIDMWSVGCIFAELWTRTPIMKGKDKLHQLALIRELRGNIEWLGVNNLPYYLEYQSYKSIDLQPKYFITDYKIHIHVPLAINFINGLLTLDPQQRLDVNTAVKSEFLQPKPSSDVFKLLLSNYSNEASHYPIRNMPNVPHDTIY